MSKVAMVSRVAGMSKVAETSGIFFTKAKSLLVLATCSTAIRLVRQANNPLRSLFTHNIAIMRNRVAHALGASNARLVFFASSIAFGLALRSSNARLVFAHV